MSRSFDDLRVAFAASVAGQQWLVFSMCREDARQALAAGAAVDVTAVSPRRAPEADEWIGLPDLRVRAVAAGFRLCGESEQARLPADHVEDEAGLRQEALDNWPGIEVLGVRQLEGVVQVHLLFDGSRHAFWLPDSGEVLLASVDRPAWLAFTAGSQPA